MQLQIFRVDAFADEVFKGNPAAVCPLEFWLPDELLQAIAMENAVAETAFFVPSGDGYELRWFTPELEIDLCGHATLAVAHVISKHLQYTVSPLKFKSKSGTLFVSVEDGRIILDFPSRMPERAEIPKIIFDAMPEKPVEVLKARDYVLVYESEEIIRNMEPDQSLLNTINLGPGGIIVTAKGSDVDFVSRFFTPQASIFEDSVTGSAHCSLIPYWSLKLGRQEMVALQLSKRGGRLFCKDMGSRVAISGSAVTFLTGTIVVPERSA